MTGPRDGKIYDSGTFRTGARIVNTGPLIALERMNALDINAQWVAIDEWKGRRVALASGVKVVGSLGLLAKAKQLGIIHTISPYIEKAQNQGIRYDNKLVNSILEHVGEL